MHTYINAHTKPEFEDLPQPQQGSELRRGIWKQAATGEGGGLRSQVSQMGNQKQNERENSVISLWEQRAISQPEAEWLLHPRKWGEAGPTASRPQ